MIPADCRVLSAKDLFVSQSAMTGESLPVEKRADASASNGAGVLDASNLLFHGHQRGSGHGAGRGSERGQPQLFRHHRHAEGPSNERAPTAFETGVNSVSWLLIRFAARSDGARGAAHQRLPPRATGPRPSCSRCPWPWA